MKRTIRFLVWTYGFREQGLRRKGNKGTIYGNCVYKGSAKLGTKYTTLSPNNKRASPVFLPTGIAF